MSESPSAPRSWPSVTGIVPSAGSSTRMGTPKGLLRLAGRTFTRCVVETLYEGGCSRVQVVVRADDPVLETEARAAGADVLVNPRPGSGPLTSLRLALQSLPGTVGHVVWLPLDHPQVEPSTVRGLLEAAFSGAAAVTLPVYQGERGHPAVFARELFAELLDPTLEGGARTVVHRCLDSGRAQLVETADPGVLVDVDTPAEYEALLRQRTTT